MDNKDLWNDMLKLSIEGIIYACLAVMGSIARTLSDNLIKRKKTNTGILLLIFANAIISGFCGLMIVPLSKILQLNAYWSLFIAGMAGWTGGVFLTVFEKIALKKFDDGSTNNNYN